MANSLILLERKFLHIYDQGSLQFDTYMYKRIQKEGLKGIV